MIDIVGIFRNLGVIFNQYLSWDNHVNYLRTKFPRVTGLISRNRFISPTNVKLFVCETIFCAPELPTPTQTNQLRMLPTTGAATVCL